MDTPISVAQLNRQAKFLLEQHFPTLLVSGEISNLARPRSGHLYFTLKDQNAQVRCAFFRGQAAQQRYQLREGDAVLVRGKLSLYEGRGDYQVIVSGVKPAGDGALQQAFEALKLKLEQEGLFELERKQPLPAQISHLGVITSASGAALQDVLNVLKRRDPGMAVTVFACTVQGQQAAGEIRRALQRAQSDTTLDALLITRGGGSAEDLWCFNDEALARDIVACSLPTVSAVGHETDFTIADFVADVRAPTPSAGAELLSVDQSVWQQRFLQVEQRLRYLMQQTLQSARTRVDHLSQRMRHPSERIREQQQRLDELDSRVRRAMTVRLNHKTQGFSHLQARLKQASPALQVERQRQSLGQIQPRLTIAMERFLSQQKQILGTQAHHLHIASPMATLERGYSISLDSQRRVIKSIQSVSPGDRLEHRLADGRIKTEVVDVEAAPSDYGRDDR